MALNKTQMIRRIGGLTVAAMICGLFTALIPSLVFALDDGACQEPARLHETSTSRQATVAPISVEEPSFTPCERARQEGAQSYNLCFEANPHPSTAVPDWVARRQAEQAVSAVFDQIVAIHNDQAQREIRRPRALEDLPHRAWVADAIRILQEQATGPLEGGSICIETDESCQEAPAPGYHQQLSQSAPVDERRAQIERPRPPLKERSEPPLVELKIGPAQGFELPKERPPQA